MDMLTVNGMCAGYGGLSVLNNININIGQGQIVSIVGANGAGKTTLLKTLSGLIRAREGTILFSGRSVARLPAHKIVALGIVHVPEGRQVFASLSVEDNLKMGSYIPRAKESRNRTLKEVYDIFPVLEKRRKQVAATLSGGEQQMLAIGRGLMARPKLLMLDEPSLGLAPLIVSNIFSVIEAINREGITVLLVEQNLTHALRMSHFAYVIESGTIALSGTGAELLANEHTKGAYFGSAGSQSEG
jgi:branched-chain amino acid transport system ATP-binding protein